VEELLPEATELMADDGTGLDFLGKDGELEARRTPQPKVSRLNGTNSAASHKRSKGDAIPSRPLFLGLNVLAGRLL
jgi:hypothetical protein